MPCLFYLSNQFLDKVLYPAKGPKAGRNINRANIIRPWLFVAPAMLALGVYLAYPVIATFIYSVTDRDQGGAFVGLANYAQMFNEPKFCEALRNNMLWLLIVPAASTSFGLLAAQLTDRISWGGFAKSLIFMPMAISFVGAAVIFKLIYDTRPIEQSQIGILNALWLQFNGGTGSFLILRLLPALFMATIGLGTLFIMRGFLKQLFDKPKGSMPMLPKLMRVAAIGLLWLIAAYAFSLVFGVLTVEFAYGKPQTWLTIKGWNSLLLMVVLIWI